MKNQKNNWKQFGKWVKVIAKRQLLRPSFYLLMAGICFLLYLTENIIIPGAGNTQVGIYAEDSTYGAKVKENLLAQTDGLEFVEVSSEEELVQDVYRGIYDCGFVLTADLDEALESRDLTESITYIYATSTTKGFVAKESVYAVLFQYLSEEILIEKVEDGSLFEDTGEDSSGEAVETVLEYNRNYLNSDEVFQVEFAGDKEDGSRKEEAMADTLYGILGTCIFAAALLYGRYRFSAEYGNIGKKLLPKERRRLLAAYIFVPVLIAGIVLQALTGWMEGKQEPGRFFAMIFFCLLCTVWTFLFSALFRREQKYLCSICAVLILNCLICPVFFDLSVYIPAVGVVQKVFPLFYYLQIILFS